MIEAMEQHIVNSINNRWTKNKDIRRNIDIEILSENFRVICSSRAKTLSIISKLKTSNTIDSLEELKENMTSIYHWITDESIESLLDKYRSELKDKMKEAEYKSEISTIIEYLDNLRNNLIELTLKKLYVFHNITTKVQTITGD